MRSWVFGYWLFGNGGYVTSLSDFTACRYLVPRCSLLPAPLLRGPARVVEAERGRHPQVPGVRRDRAAEVSSGADAVAVVQVAEAGLGAICEQT